MTHTYRELNKDLGTNRGTNTRYQLPGCSLHGMVYREVKRETSVHVSLTVRFTVSSVQN